MGIRWFETFLKQYPIALLTSCSVHDQYIVIDGSEIMYQLFADIQKNGRGNYIEYRENIMKFFATLQDCGIKPIIVSDGFKFNTNITHYISRRIEKIQMMIDAVNGSSCRNTITIKPHMCGMVFKQTIEELEIIYVDAEQDTDEDLAALSKIINAPVLAADTVFSAYSLQDGYIPMRTFDWKHPQMSQGQKSIKAQIFRIEEFVERFRVDQEAVRFLAILFGQRNFEQFKNFRETVLKNVRIPPHLRFSRGTRFRRPNFIENCLIWFSNNNRSTDDAIDMILEFLSREVDVEEVREKIIENLQKYKDPQIRVQLLHKIQDKVSDADCRAKLEFCIERFSDHQDQDDDEETYNGEDNRVLYLPLIPTDPTRYESPHTAAASIRHVMYNSRLVRFQHDALTIKEYHRVGLNYEEVGEITVNRSFEKFYLFDPETPENEDIDEERKSFLLEVLIEDEEHRHRFKDNINNISDDLKLTLAATIYWINQTMPGDDIVNAFVFLFTITQLKQSSEAAQVISLLEFIETRAGRNFFNVEMLQWSAQWEACLKESIIFNRALSHPLPSPIVGKVFSGCILEQIHALTSSDMNEARERLRRIDGAEKLENIIRNILR